MKNKLKIYCKLMAIPFFIFLVLSIICVYFAQTTKAAIGYCLIIFILFSIIALRNLFIIFDIKDEKDENQ